MACPLTGDPKPLAQEWVKWSGSGENKSAGLLDTEVPQTVVPKPTGGALTHPTTTWTECQHVMVDGIVKVGMFKRIII